MLILSQFKKGVPLKPVLGGRGQCCTNTLLHMNRLNKTESALFVSSFKTKFYSNKYSDRHCDPHPFMLDVLRWVKFTRI